MKFVDEVKVFVSAGSGGPGCISWRREAHVPRGGPDGGDGGNGGAIIFVADENLNTLIDLAMNPHIRAEEGKSGGDNNKTGADGESTFISVPAGTQIFYQDTLVADMSQPNCKWVAARGGKGGKGNTFFKSSKNQSPQSAQAGIPGDSREYKLVLKSIADVGLVGFPNVGKSTLLRSTSRAHAKVADYPFTTLTPNLGVVSIGETGRFVMADVPGLIEGASSGKGLGIEFLKHLERTKVLVLIVDLYTNADGHKQDFENEELDDKKILELFDKQFKIMHGELINFSQELANKLRLIAFSKIDLELNSRALKLTGDSYNGIKVLGFSSHQQVGLEEIKDNIFKEINNLKASEQQKA